jgi:hypothetical protein
MNGERASQRASERERCHDGHGAPGKTSRGSSLIEKA